MDNARNNVLKMERVLRVKDKRKDYRMMVIQQRKTKRRKRNMLGR
jgi:hypothetical protein